MNISKILESILSLPYQTVDKIQNSLIRLDKKNSNFYGLDSTKRDENGQLIVFYRTLYTGKLLHCELEKLVSEREDILSGFDVKDIKTIVSLANKSYKTKIEIAENPEPRFLSIFSMLFVATFLLTNITASKIGNIYGIPVTGAVFIHPFIYIFGNIITEVYGYKKIRVVIWGTLFCNIFMAIALYTAILIPAHSVWHNQIAYQTILGSVPRIILASMIAFFSGEFVNSYFLAKIKLWTKGKNLLFRIIVSSFFAISLDTTLFVVIAFGFTVPAGDFLLFTVRIYLTKLFFDIICYPIVRSVCTKVKRCEKMDIFDIRTNFTPFSLENTYQEKDNFWNIARVKIN